MKKLDDIIKGRGEVKGFTFHKVAESDHAYAYEQRFDETGQVMGYEVFEKRVNTMFDCESYPKSEAFGIWAYAVNDKSNIKVYMDMIDDRVRKRNESKENRKNDKG